MPTYEFRCPSGHDFERFYGKISDAPGEVPCPECGAVAARRISGGAGLLFKGSGFYITDYGKDGKKDVKAAQQPKPEGGTGGAPMKSDAGSSDSSGSSATPSAPTAPSSGSPSSGSSSSSKPAGGE